MFIDSLAMSSPLVEHYKIQNMLKDKGSTIEKIKIKIANVEVMITTINTVGVHETTYIMLLGTSWLRDANIAHKWEQ